MRVLDLFAGLKGWSRPFEDRRHTVLAIEWDQKFDGVVHMDVRDLQPKEVRDRLGGSPDIVLASPPCESFSVGSFRHHWRATAVCSTCGVLLVRLPGERWGHEMGPQDHEGRPSDGTFRVRPKSETGRMGLTLLTKTLDLIYAFPRAMFVIENPRALMRKMPEVQRLERRTVTYCQYGKTVMKPTDLWGGFPPSLVLKPACKNGAPCHEAAPRGAKTGTQGLTTAEAGRIPYDLALAVCEAAERDLALVAS